MIKNCTLQIYFLTFRRYKQSTNVGEKLSNNIGFFYMELAELLIAYSFLCSVLVCNLDGFHCDDERKSGRQWIFNKNKINSSHWFLSKNHWFVVESINQNEKLYTVVIFVDLSIGFQSLIQLFLFQSLERPFFLFISTTSTIIMSMDWMFDDLGRNALAVIALSELYWFQFSCNKSIWKRKVPFYRMTMKTNGKIMKIKV